MLLTLQVVVHRLGRSFVKLLFCYTGIHKYSNCVSTLLGKAESLSTVPAFSLCSFLRSILTVLGFIDACF